MSKQQSLKIDDSSIQNNIYYKDNPQSFLKLKEIVEKNPNSYHKILNAKGHFKSDGSFQCAQYEHLMLWINKLLESNHIETNSTAQKVFMILYGLNHFPKCKNPNCQNDMSNSAVSLFDGKFRQSYCCKSCANEHMKREVSMSQASQKRREFDQRLSEMSKIEQLKFLVKEFPDNYPDMIRSRSWLMQFVNESTLLLQSNIYTMPTKLFWIFNNIKSWDDDRVRCQNPKCKKSLIERNVIGSSIPRYCSSKCAMTDSSVQSKIRKTSLDSYGCSWPSASHQAQVKSKAVYQLDDYNFKSSWEVAFYLFHRDRGDDVIYTPDCNFSYVDPDGKQHSYFPDFELNGKFIEIKGNHFISKEGSFTNPFDHSQDQIYEAKRQCMISNDVQMLTYDDVKDMIKYVSQKYGKTFMQSIRRKSKQV